MWHSGKLDLISHLNISRGGCLLPVFPFQNCTSVLIQLDVDDDNLTGVNANGYAGTIGFVSLYAVDVYHPFLTIHLRHLSITSLVLPPNNPNFVILANR